MVAQVVGKIHLGLGKDLVDECLWQPTLGGKETAVGQEWVKSGPLSYNII